jgi:MoaA/NifB/PqqE/SkfB family radical SAM enzyme
MSFLNRIKQLSREQAIKRMLELLPRFSSDNLIKMTYLAERIIGNEQDKEKVRYLRQIFQETPSAFKIAQEVVERISPNCRRKFVENFIINALLKGGAEREEFAGREGFLPPFLIVISPTMRCNLRCPGCYAGDYAKDFGLEIGVVDDIIGQAREMGIYFITFTGGEIFTRPDIFEMYEKYDDVYFQLYTNGLLITEDVARRLSELGNVAPMISVEGFREETNSRRGEGVFDKVTDVMERLKRHGIVFGFSATAMRNNTHLLSSDEFIDYMVEKGCLVGWYFQYVPMGRRPDLNMMATPEQRNTLRERITALRLRKPIFIGDFWDDGPSVGGCIAGGRQYLHINANGDIEPCVFAHFAVDNIKNKTLKEALQSDFFKAIRARQPYDGNLLRPCMIIDSPHVLRELVSEFRACPTHPGAGSLLTELAPGLDEYARRFGEITNPIWESEFQQQSEFCLAGEKEHERSAKV